MLLAGFVALLGSTNAFAVPTFPCHIGTGTCYELRDLPLETVVDFSIRGFSGFGTLQNVSILAGVQLVYGQVRIYNPTPLPIPAFVELRYSGGAYGGVDWGPFSVDELRVVAGALQDIPPGEALTVPFASYASDPPPIPQSVYAPSFVTWHPVSLAFDTGSLTPIFTSGLEVDITTARVGTAQFDFTYEYQRFLVVGAEPTTVALLGLGTVGLLTRRWARKR
jgi:hypothetical protein